MRGKRLCLIMAQKKKIPPKNSVSWIQIQINKLNLNILSVKAISVSNPDNKQTERDNKTSLAKVGMLLVATWFGIV